MPRRRGKNERLERNKSRRKERLKRRLPKLRESSESKRNFANERLKQTAKP